MDLHVVYIDAFQVAAVDGNISFQKVFCDGDGHVKVESAGSEDHVVAFMVDDCWEKIGIR